MKDSDIRELVRAGFDLHVHVGPDILPRKYTARKLMEEEKGKIRGLGLKAHSFPTLPQDTYLTLLIGFKTHGF